MIEPQFVSQCADPMTDEEARRWFRDRADEAKAQGCRHTRASADDADNPTMFLFEGWTQTSREVAEAGGEGGQRWAFAAPQHQGEAE